MKKLHLGFLLIYMAFSTAAYAFSQNGSGNVAAAGGLTGTTLASGVVNSSLQTLGTISSGIWQGTPIANLYLANPATTVNGQTCTLGSSCTVTASAGTVTTGTTTVAGGANGNFLYNNSGVLGEKTPTQATAALNQFTSSLQGLVPGSGGGTTNFLRADGTWAVAGSGTVTTTGSPSSGNLTKFSGATSITSADLSGDVTTSGTLATTLAKIQGVTVSGVSGTGNVVMSSELGNLNSRGPSFSALNPVIGQQGTYWVAPCNGAIAAYDFVVDAGTATVQTWKIATGTTAPTVSNSISTSGVQISTGTALRSTSTGDFTTTTVTTHDIFALYLSAVSGVSKMYFQIEINCTY